MLRTMILRIYIIWVESFISFKKKKKKDTKKKITFTQTLQIAIYGK